MKLQVYKQGKLVSFKGPNTLVVKQAGGFGWGCAGWVAAWFVPSFLQFPPWLGGLFFVGLVFVAIRYITSTGNQTSLPIVEHLELDTTEHLLSIEATKGEERQVWDLPTSSIRTIQIRTLGLTTGLNVELSPSLDLAFEMTFEFEEFVGSEPLSVYCHIQGIRETSDLEQFTSSLSAMIGLNILLLMERGQKEARFFLAKEYPLELQPLERLDSIEYPEWITDRLLGLEETPSSLQTNTDSEEASFFESIDEKEQQELLSETKIRKPRAPRPSQNSTLPFPAPLVRGAPDAPITSYQHSPKQTPHSPTATAPHSPTAAAPHRPQPPQSPTPPQSSTQPPQSPTPPPQSPTPPPQRRPKQPKPSTQPTQPRALPQTSLVVSQEEAFTPPVPQASSIASQEEAFAPPSPPAEMFTPTVSYDTSIKELPWLTGESKGHWPEWSSFSSSQQSKPALSWPTWDSQDPK